VKKDIIKSPSVSEIIAPYNKIKNKNEKIQN
jgi:hypothetical protein